MSEELKIIISAQVDKLKSGVESAKTKIQQLKDKVKEAGKEIGEQLTKAGETAAGMAKKIGAGIAAVGAAAVGAIKGTEEYREQMAMLTTAYESTGKSADAAKKTYNDLYRVLGDTGQATEAAQQLAKVADSEEGLTQATGILKGVYATFGDSLPIEGLAEAWNHTQQVGQVQGVLADALEWSGVNLEEFNKRLAAAYEEGEGDVVIWETLTDLYWDAGEAYEENNKKILEQREAQANLTAAIAKVGETLAPVLTYFTQFGATLLEKVSPIITELSEKYLPVMKEALEQAAEKVGLLITWITDNWDIIKEIATIILAVVAAFTALNGVMKVVNIAMALFSANPITLAIGAIIVIIAALATNAFGLRDKWNAIWDKIKEKIKQVYDYFKPTIDAIVNLFKSAWELIKLAWDLVKPYFEGIWNGIKGVFKGVGDTLGTYFRVAWNNIKAVFDTVKTFFTAVVQTIAGVFGAVKGVLTGNFKEAWESIKSIFKPWGDFFKSLWNTIKTLFTGMAETIASTFGNIIKSAVNFVLSGVIGVINGVINGINFALRIINAIPGVNINEIKKLDLPQLARGGVVDKATLAVVGEQGKEMVMPLENNLEYLDKLAAMISARMGGGNRPIVLEVDGKVFAETSISAINNLTEQTGNLALRIV